MASTIARSPVGTTVNGGAGARELAGALAKSNAMAPANAPAPSGNVTFGDDSGVPRWSDAARPRRARSASTVTATACPSSTLIAAATPSARSAHHGDAGRTRSQSATRA